MDDIPALALTPIGELIGDYSDKFGVPRQPGLVESARGVLSLIEPWDDPLAVEGITAYSHIWLSFIFDRSPAQTRMRVRPPRLGGNARVGVFATRSTHRPNRLGLSLVRLLDVATTPRPGAPPWSWLGSLSGPAAPRPARTHLLIGGHDLVSGTPVVDIKPYLPWAEARPQARADLAPKAPPARLAVAWREAAAALVAARTDGDSLRALIEQVLAQDPRPAYRRAEVGRGYGVALRDVDVRFGVDDGRRLVTVLEVLAQPPI